MMILLDRLIEIGYKSFVIKSINIRHYLKTRMLALRKDQAKKRVLKAQQAREGADRAKQLKPRFFKKLGLSFDGKERS